VQIEQQKVLTQQAQHVKQAQSKLNKVHTDQENRVAALERAANIAERNACTLEANLNAVNAAIAAVNAQLASGIAWRDLVRLLEEQRAAGAPLAQLIAGLKLDEGRATLLLEDHGDESDEEEGGGQGHIRKGPLLRRIEVDLSANAYINAMSGLPHFPLCSLLAVLYSGRVCSRLLPAFGLHPYAPVHN
jgi:hypothetical protein